MRKIKKLAALGIAAALTAGTLAGCGGGKAAETRAEAAAPAGGNGAAPAENSGEKIELVVGHINAEDLSLIHI